MKKADANTVTEFLETPSSSEPRTRIVGMKWKKLGEDADPEWDKEVFLFEAPGTFAIGSLTGIQLTPTGKVFTFVNGDATAWTNKFSHYAVPTIPK
jgi:hypothetical protein